VGSRQLELALKLEPLLRAKAKEKQQEHGRTAPGKTLKQKSAEVNTRAELAKIAGVSHDTIAFTRSPRLTPTACAGWPTASRDTLPA
jgi:hypothetical protein